jgi:hypothetical protein
MKTLEYDLKFWQDKRTKLIRYNQILEKEIPEALETASVTRDLEPALRLRKELKELRKDVTRLWTLNELDSLCEIQTKFNALTQKLSNIT